MSIILSISASFNSESDPIHALESSRIIIHVSVNTLDVRNESLADCDVYNGPICTYSFFKIVVKAYEILCFDPNICKKKFLRYLLLSKNSRHYHIFNEKIYIDESKVGYVNLI